MAALPEFRRILREDIPAAPDWINQLITPLNLFNEQTYNSLNGRLTIGQNISGMVYQGQFATPANYSDGVNSHFSPILFQFTGTYTPTSCILGAISLVSSATTPMIKPVSLSWSQSTNSSTSASLISVNYVTGLAASSTYNITLLVL